MIRTRREVERLLLVIDDSPSCVNAVKYTAKMLGHRRGFRIHLLHLLPPLPPELLEFGGCFMFMLIILYPLNREARTLNNSSQLSR